MATIYQQQNLDLYSSLQHSTPVFRAAVATSSLAVAPRIDRLSAGQALVRCDEPCSIAVDVTGYPVPEVTWHIGRRRIRDSPKYHTTVDGHRHTLVVSRVTMTLEKGIWIRACNETGEDNCIIPVKTYKVFSGMRFSFEEGTVQQTACAPDVVLHRSATTRSKLRRPTSSLCSDDHQSAMSVPFAVEAQEDWHREMALRNRMRSVDDLQQYKVWKMSDSSQSIDGTHSTSSGRQLRRVYVRRNRSVGNVTDQSSVDGDTCDGNDRSSRQRERRRKKTDTTRSMSAAAPTVGLTSGVASAPPFTGRTSSVDRKLRGPSADRQRAGGSITGNPTSKRINSTPHVNGSADETGKRGTVKGRSTRSSSGVMTSPNSDSINVDSRVLRPPTGRASHLDRSRTSKKKSTRESKTSLPVENSQQTPLTSSNGTQRNVGDQLSTAKEDNNDVWKLCGVRLVTLVHTLLVSRDNDELSSGLSSLNGVENCSSRSTSTIADRRDAVELLRSPSSLSQTKAIDAAVLTLDTNNVHGIGTTSLSELAALPMDAGESSIDGVENPRSSMKLEYKYRTSVIDDSLDGSTVVSDTSTLENDDGSQHLAENKIADVGNQSVIESRADEYLPASIEDAIVEHGACAEHGKSNCTYEHGEIMINRPQDNGAIDALFPDSPANWHQKNANSNDVNNLNAIFSQTVDLQKILCTIDQLIGVGSDDDSIRRWNAKFHAIDQHQPILETSLNTVDSRPEMLDAADGRRRVVPTTVVKRGGIRVHSDGEDDGNELELDTESFYNDAGLSATLDLGGAMAAADNTDNDDDDFDSGEYERDAEVHDLGVHPGKTSQSTLTLSDRFG